MRHIPSHKLRSARAAADGIGEWKGPWTARSSTESELTRYPHSSHRPADRDATQHSTGCTVHGTRYTVQHTTTTTASSTNSACCTEPRTNEAGRRKEEQASTCPHNQPESHHTSSYLTQPGHCKSVIFLSGIRHHPLVIRTFIVSTATAAVNSRLLGLSSPSVRLSVSVSVLVLVPSAEGMEIALPQCAFGDVDDQPSAPSSPTQCLSVSKCTSPRSCCTRALADEHRLQLSHHQHRQHDQPQHNKQQHDSTRSLSSPFPSTGSVSASFAPLSAVSVPSDIVQRLRALNSAYATLEERVHEESTRPLLGAEAANGRF